MKRLTDLEYIELLQRENKILRYKIKKLEEEKSMKLEKDFQESQKRTGEILSVLIKKIK
jgi:hypothetical protein